MKIIRADIFGFGKWIDQTFNFHDRSLICFYGENESGKTTLQQFLVYMLFGFPRRKRKIYKPKMSSTLGGRLVLLSESIGEFSIERLDDEVTCYLIDGTERDGQWLNEQLNGMTEEMYRSIYSFSALDLSGIQEMKDESLGEILFSIGLTGATDIYTVERNIDRKIGELFKPTGRVPKINKQVSRLNSLHKQLTKYERIETSYRNKIDEKSLLIHRLEKLEDELQRCKEQLFTYEKIRHTFPTIRDYHKSHDELQQINSKMCFPEDGISRLNELKKVLIPLQSECELLKESKQKYKQLYDEAVNTLHSDELYETAGQLIKERELYSENKRTLQSIHEKIVDMEEQINETLNELDIGLTETDISNLSFPFHVETIWTELSREDELLQLEKDQLQEEQHILLRKKEQLYDEQTVLSQKQLQEEQLQSLSTKLNKDERLKGQLSEQKSRKKQWSKTKTIRLQRMKTMFYGSIIVALLSFISGFIFDVKFLYVIGAAIGAVGVVQQIMSQRSIQEMEKLINEADYQSHHHLSKEERHRLEKLLEEQQSIKNELNLIEKSLKELHIEELKWEEREHLYKQKKLKHEQLIEEQRLQYPFLHDIAATHWLKLRENLKRLQNQLNERDKLTETMEKVNEKLTITDVQITQFLKEINASDDVQPFQFIETWLQNERDLLREKEQYGEFLTESKNKYDTIRHKCHMYITEMNDLFAIAKVQSEEQFFERANKLERYNHLLEKRHNCLQQLSLTFGEDEVQTIINEQSNEREIELNITVLSDKVTEIEQTINEQRDQLAEVEANLKQLEMSEQYSELIHLLEVEQEKLAELTFEWTILQTAKEGLIEAKRSYRNKYLTEVIEKTSYYFSLITDNAYIKVFPPTESDPFFVETAHHVRYEVNELSQGTVDQLYVSLRLAISEVMSERYDVPFMIDDAFVHFDGKRTKNIVDVLLEIGKHQQVILFTCKHDIKQFMPSHVIHKISETVSVD